MTVLYAVLIGAASGVVANVLGWISDVGRRRSNTTASDTAAANTWRSLLLGHAENVLAQASPADFETTQNAASMCVAVVSNLEGGDGWRAGYGSLDAFYAAHEARHPDIRLYGSVYRELDLQDPNDPPNGIGAEIARRIAVARNAANAGS